MPTPTAPSGRPARTDEFRRARSLVFHFESSSLLCRNYVTGASFATTSSTVGILAHFAEWISFDELCERLAPATVRSVATAVTRLEDAGLVVRRGSDAAARDEAFEQWAPWAPDAALLHFGTKPTFSTEPRTPDEESFAAQRLAEQAEPPRVKLYPDRPHLALAVPTDVDAVTQVLLGRRTHRRFARGAVGRDALAALLWRTFAFTSERPWPGLGTVPLRTSPSGGARHPVEAYLVAQRVEGLAPGIYHYRPDVHALEHLSDERPPVDRWCGFQPWIAGCAALVVMTAVVARSMWRYQFSRAYRVLLLETGHLGQTFCLAATHLGLAPFVTAALDDARIESALGLDGVSETVVYAAGVGLPVATPASRAKRRPTQTRPRRAKAGR